MSVVWTVEEHPNPSRKRIERIFLAEVTGVTTADLIAACVEIWLQVATVAVPLYPPSSWDHIVVHFVSDAGTVSFEPYLRSVPLAKQRAYLGEVVARFQALRENWRTLEVLPGLGPDENLGDALFSETVALERERFVAFILVAWGVVCNDQRVASLHGKEVVFQAEGSSDRPFRTAVLPPGN